jgi:hypothetical protein
MSGVIPRLQLITVAYFNLNVKRHTLAAAGQFDVEGLYASFGEANSPLQHQIDLLPR